jgi:hypothetical protein
VIAPGARGGVQKGQLAGIGIDHTQWSQKPMGIAMDL